MVLRDNDIRYLDSMIDAYAAVTAYVDRVPELESKIAIAYQQVCASRPEFDSFSSILTGGTPHRERWVRHVAWTAQHAFRARAYCVGNKVLLKKDGQVESPLVHQLRILGYQTVGPTSWSPTREQTNELDGGGLLDAMVVDAIGSQVFIIKGLAHSRATRATREVGRHQRDLFDVGEPFDRNLFVASKKLQPLHAAYSVLRRVLPHVKVVPVIAVLDEPYAGWAFRAFDVSSAMRDPERKSPRCLADYPVIKSSDALRLEGRDQDSLRYLPNWAVSDPFQLLPVDRATRCLTALNIVWNKQREYPDRLAVVRSVDIQEVVRSKHLIEYTVDLRRHDLEDCLERGGLMERPAFEGNAVALTSKGLARLLLLKRLLLGRTEVEDDEDLRTHILGHVHRQAVLWASYRSGLAICV